MCWYYWGFKGWPLILITTNKKISHTRLPKLQYKDYQNAIGRLKKCSNIKPFSHLFANFRAKFEAFTFSGVHIRYCLLASLWIRIHLKIIYVNQKVCRVRFCLAPYILWNFVYLLFSVVEIFILIIVVGSKQWWSASRLRMLYPTLTR